MERVLLLLFVVGLCQAAQKYTRTVSYEDELVARCNGVEGERFQHLLGLDGVDVWTITPDGSADIRMKKELYKELKGDYPECFILHSSVEQLVRDAEREMRPKNLTADWFEEYHRYDDIVEWYQALAEKFDIVTFVSSIGKSFEGRDQPAVHITAASEPTKKIYFQCQIHAREWISGATCMYIASFLAENYENNERVANLLKEVEFIFVPFVNPDGYEYTWTNSRLWRKNRRPGTLCDGVDLNRNYNDHWAEGGSSGSECSETYHGKSAESEPETQNTANYFRTSGNIVGAIDWHSYSQLILRPYGWTYDDSPDEAQLKELGDNMKAVILTVHGKSYTSQKSIGLYKTTGTASDWFYSDNANENNEYRAAGYTIELRDTGQYGFQLPPDQIIPTGEENVVAVLAFAEELVAKPLNK